MARDGVTVLPLDEDDYLRPQSTINSANNSRDNRLAPQLFVSLIHGQLSLLKFSKFILKLSEFLNCLLFCSAGSVGKDYYSDPKYLNVLTGAVGKLQEVIPSTSNAASQHLNGRSDANGGLTNPKKGPKAFAAVASTQPSSLKYPQVGVTVTWTVPFIFYRCGDR